MRRHVWGNRVISHFAVPWQNLSSLSTPHAKQAPRIAAVASRRHKDDNPQNIASSPVSLSLSLSFFSAPANSLRRTERKSMPLTVDFGNQRRVSAQRKLLRTPAPVSGTEAVLLVIAIDKPPFLVMGKTRLFFFLKQQGFPANSF